jgi:hypothetical protein
MMAAKTTAIGRKRDKFVFILPILYGLIRLRVIGAAAGDWRGGKTAFFVFQRVKERARLRFAHLARLAL